jgi:hypothetical protein
MKKVPRSQALIYQAQALSDQANVTTTPADPAPRCQYRSPSGYRCRRTRGADIAFCASHDPNRLDNDQGVSANLAPLLAVAPETFHTAEGINRSLSNLFTLLAEGRVSPRRAAVLAYVGSLLLRTLPAIQLEHESRAPKKNGPVRIVWDLLTPPEEREAQEDSAHEVDAGNQARSRNPSPRDPASEEDRQASGLPRGRTHG